MSSDQPFLDQLGDGAFERRIALQIDERSVRTEPFDQVTGRDDEPELEPRRQDLRQRADVDDDAGSIGARERQRRAAAVMKLVIVVVFDDREPVLRRELPASASRRAAVSVTVVGY